jgi:phosphoribosylaminoimidazolecarboxamide formyltransferase/IMP cyclohydrolase
MTERRYALISVSDKTGIVEFATALAEMGFTIVSTGGSARALHDAGVAVTPIESLTGVPEMLDGRVKTLHPIVHGGILYRRDLAEHVQAAQQAGIGPIDVVCVNLYPFARTVASGADVQDCIENIDIGGPAMVRSAAKNHAHVAIVTDPSDYPSVLEDMLRNGGRTSLETRKRLAAKAYALTAAYDADIAAWMAEYAGETSLPERFTLGGTLAYVCRYGENLHQRAAFYRQLDRGEPGIGHARVLGGKQLSFNNLCDANAALEAVKDLDDAPACVIVKHANPCGAALGQDSAQAFAGALEGDPISAFGGIVAFSRDVDEAAALPLTEPGTFFEVIIAPRFEPSALEILAKRPKWGANVRLLEVGDLHGWRDKVRGWEVRQLVGGFVVQERDLNLLNDADLKVVSRRAPSADEMESLRFAWRLVKHVKSNAIVVVRGTQLVGVGAGQMNRVQSVRLAVGHAGERARGAVLASDAFFPFSDGPEAAAEAGVTAIIHPGGSRRDADTVAVCDAHNIALIYTGVRHFRH